MNRAERRRQSHSAVSDPIITMKRSDIERIKQEATEDAITLLLSIPIKVMHEQFGWGMTKRLPQLSEALINEYQSFADGEISLKEYQDMVYEYCGVKFKKTEED